MPAIAVIVAIALQAFLAAQLGLAAYAKIAERWRERAERRARTTLILLGIYLIAEQLTRSRTTAPSRAQRADGSR